MQTSVQHMDHKKGKKKEKKKEKKKGGWLVWLYVQPSTRLVGWLVIYIIYNIYNIYMEREREREREKESFCCAVQVIGR
jgi:hypothetical protein